MSRNQFQKIFERVRIFHYLMQPVLPKNLEKTKDLCKQDYDVKAIYNYISNKFTDDRDS